MSNVFARKRLIWRRNRKEISIRQRLNIFSLSCYFFHKKAPALILRGLLPSDFFTAQSTINKVPAVISINPTADFAVKGSWKIRKAKMMVRTTLNLSMGTTLEASPIWSAL